MFDRKRTIHRPRFENCMDMPDQRSLCGSGDLTEGMSVFEMRQELLDCYSRIDSLRIELRRAENDVYRLERLKDMMSHERLSISTLFKVVHLLFSSAIPDVIKLLLRPLTRLVKWSVRYLEMGGTTTGYDVRPLQKKNRARKRVLHAIANFKMGGSSRLVVDLVEKLSDGYQHEVLTGYIPAPSAYRGIPVHECRSPFGILFILRRFQPDILHVHYWGDVDFAWYDKVFSSAEKIGCKVIENINTPVVPYRSPIVRRYVFVSDYVRRQFGRSGDSYEIVYPGSDVSLFSQARANRIPDNCIGMVYRLEPDKLNGHSIDVFVEVAKRRPNTKILIVGQGSLLASYKQIVRSQGVAGAFTFTGAVPYVDLPSLYAQMSVFVAPVWKESFGQVSAFAMSMGIPIAGFRVGGLEEIVDDDDLLAPCEDSGCLADIVIRLLDDPAARRRIGERNLVRVKSLFSIEQMVSKYEALYRCVGDSGK